MTISPKYWAEHLGMPYHQAAIREQERPRPGREATGLMKLSSGSRSFLRYGYGDLLREDRWGVLHRIWPGTERVLLWGDPLWPRPIGRFAFCGSDGVEIIEPLSFKGRRGSGLAGGRCAYADASRSSRTTIGRSTSIPIAFGDVCSIIPMPSRRMAAALKQYGAAGAVEAALANASRILPL